MFQVCTEWGYFTVRSEYMYTTLSIWFLHWAYTADRPSGSETPSNHLSVLDVGLRVKDLQAGNLFTDYIVLVSL